MIRFSDKSWHCRLGLHWWVPEWLTPGHFCGRCHAIKVPS